LCCGQVFRWEKIGDWWYGVAGGTVFKVRQIGQAFEYENAKEDFIENYFSLNDNLEEILESINKDSHIRKAIRKYWGLRIIRQNPWECLASYICATYKSIAAIKHMLNNLSEKFGHRKTLDRLNFFTFPTCEKIANAKEEELRACGLGYRAKYLLKTSQMICEKKFDLETLKNQPYDHAKKTLMGFSGVGAKVADCVLLFSLGKTEAFPVDIWVKRVILNHYSEKLPVDLNKRLQENRSISNRDYEHLNSFGREYFGKYAGYAQEYLYHFERMRI
jgi:N-glycosylase/DNA lyase